MRGLDPALGPVAAWGARHHPNPRARWLCLDYLDHMAGPEAAETFIAALADPVPRVRRHAIHALVCDACKPGPVEADAVTPLRRLAAHDPSPKVRLAALRALLGRLGPGQRMAAIDEVIGRGDRGLLDAVARARPRAVPADLRTRAHQALASQPSRN